MTDEARTPPMVEQLAQMRELFADSQRPIPEAIEPLTTSLELLCKPDGTPIEIEAFLVSDEGAQLLNKLLGELTSGNLTTDFINVFKRANEAYYHPDTPPTFISRLMELGITEGLDQRAQQGLFSSNPALVRLQKLIALAHHEGSNDGQRIYKNIRIVIMNIIRAEALAGRHNPEFYQEFCSSLKYVRGRDHTLQLPNRLEPEKRINVSYPGEPL